MILAENVAVMRIFFFPLIIHLLPVLNVLLLNSTPDMEIHLAALEIALEKHALFWPVFANMAEEAFSLFVGNSLDLFVVGVAVPDLWHPVDASDMSPSHIVFS